MPLNVQDLIDELRPNERRKVDELTEKLRAEHDAYHLRTAASGPQDTVPSHPRAANTSERRSTPLRPAEPQALPLRYQPMRPCPPTTPAPRPPFPGT